MKKALVLTSILSVFNFLFASNAEIQLIQNSQNELEIAINADSNVYGLQFDLVCKGSITDEQVNHAFSNNDSRSNMSVYSRLKDNGVVRVIMFDLGGQPIVTSNNTEKVLNIDVNNTASNDLTRNSNNSTVSDCICDNIVVAGEHGEEMDATTATVFSDDLATPSETKITGNYPNPFNPSTTIEFDLSSENAGLINVVVYDLQGRVVDTLFDGYMSEGAGHKLVWDASSVASGKYFAVLSTPNGFSDTVYMTLIK